MGNRPSPLRKALRWYDVDAVQSILEEAGGDAARLINDDYSQDCLLQSCSRSQMNSFLYAVSCNRLSLLPLLIERGADVHATGACGESALHIAARHNYVEAARLLQGAGLDLRTTDDQGRLPIHSCGLTSYNTSAMISFLLETAPGSRDDVNARDFHERTPLHGAVVSQNVDVILTLLKYGADVTATSTEGDTPVDLAREGGPVWSLLMRHRTRSMDTGAGEIGDQNGNLPPQQQL